MASNQKNILGVAIVCVLLIGGGVVLWTSRPAAPTPKTAEELAAMTAKDEGSMEEEDAIEDKDPQKMEGEDAMKTEDAASAVGGGEGKTAGYLLAEVALHNTPEDCWSTINGHVYDLTSWISRHPGGPQAIKALCGIDGTERFVKKHGTDKAQAAALAMLKIGDLAN